MSLWLSLSEFPIWAFQFSLDSPRTPRQTPYSDVMGRSHHLEDKYNIAPKGQMYKREAAVFSSTHRIRSSKTSSLLLTPPIDDFSIA